MLCCECVCVLLGKQCLFQLTQMVQRIRLLHKRVLLDSEPQWAQFCALYVIGGGVGGGGGGGDETK